MALHEQAEMARKQQRAARFGTDSSAPMYAPAEIPEDEVKKQQRAERFGTEYKASEGLMDIGRRHHIGWPASCTVSRDKGPRAAALMTVLHHKLRTQASRQDHGELVPC